MRSAFLKYTQAIHTNPELYALWLYTYISRGGEVTHPYDYDMPNFWTPTTSNHLMNPLWCHAGMDQTALIFSIYPTSPQLTLQAMLDILQFARCNLIRIASLD